ncbi:MAG TPA: SPOR domain-containing protein [Candidatus Acidoferrales bacterium]|nr:SPOR domain-containing protein [Candidatus Acidoferrales bacterium]
MASGSRKSGGERTLEGRHVIGLFLLMLVFSGVFFTLGFVMGRSQYESDVRASSSDPASIVRDKSRAADAAAAKKSPLDARPQPAGSSASPPPSDWDFYHAAEPKSSVDHLTPLPARNAAAKTVAVASKYGAGSPAALNSAKNKSSLTAPAIPGGAIVLQVAALTKESDALALAGSLQKKGFPAFVLTPGADHFYRVQVGPYADAQSSSIARKGLEKAGFKAIVRR